MRLNNLCIVLIISILIGGGNSAYSQTDRSEIFINYRVNSAQIDANYSDNAQQISNLISFLRQVQYDPTVKVESLSFCGSASPEGSHQYNQALARARMQALENLVRSEVNIPDSIIRYDDNYIPWDYLATQIALSDFPRKEMILEILNDEPNLVPYYDDRTIDNRVIRLKGLGRKLWKRLLREYFTPMRSACGVTVTLKRESPSLLSAQLDTLAVALPPAVVEPLAIAIPAVETWVPRLTLKTNALGWGAGITNAGIEADLVPHWSVSVPFYYSAWNYFTSTVKFRTLAFQPEARYWFSPKNDGLFVGGHLGVAWYNVAVDGEYRIQDHNGTSPAWGGGFSVGYRMPVSLDKRWKVEFTLGAGVYGLYYDKFRNVNNGLLVSTERKTYFGLDQAAISFSYTFDLKKGGSRW